MMVVKFLDIFFSEFVIYCKFRYSSSTCISFGTADKIHLDVLDIHSFKNCNFVFLLTPLGEWRNFHLNKLEMPKSCFSD